MGRLISLGCLAEPGVWRTVPLGATYIVQGSLRCCHSACLLLVLAMIHLIAESWVRAVGEVPSPASTPTLPLHDSLKEGSACVAHCPRGLFTALREITAPFLPLGRRLRLRQVPMEGWGHPVNERQG